jgi:hypothetical protein
VTQATTIQQPPHINIATVNPLHVTLETWDSEITAEHFRSGGAIGDDDPTCAVNVLPVRMREKAEIDKGEPAVAPAPKRGRKDTGSKPKRPKKPAAPPVQTQMMKGKEVIGPVNTLCETDVKVIMWGSLINLSQ